ncbi:MAG: hypothetical protein JST17_07635 [Bacteroidetes bacterium]|nr:hypothetical protein [Bacteroidota bacterium]MBS1931609.1 hypothetical protein [Bacteroidota bacterium]
MVEENFSPEQSLKVIHSMLERTKQDFSDNSFYLILWGWLIFIAAISQYLLMTVFKYPQSYLVWNLMWVGAIISIVRSIRKEKKIKVKTYMGETMKYFGIGCGITFTVLAFIFIYYNIWQFAFPVYFLLYGLLSFVSGAIIRYVPLRWAGVACWAISIVAVFVKFDIQVLLMALAIVLSYIVPGYLLRAEHKKRLNEN